MTDLEINLLAPRRRKRLRYLQLLLFVLATYLIAAYLVLPALWTHHEHQKGLANLPMVTRTAQGIPGDPMNEIGRASCRERV